MNTTRTSRRGLFASAGATLAAAAAPALAHVDPSSRTSAAGAPYKLAVAAYGFRKFLAGENPSMTLPEFIRKAAEMGTDGVELTEYYFKKPITHEYVMELKRQAHLWGQTITGTPVGNVFTHGPGKDRDKEVAKFLEWIDISAELGSPVIRTFAGNAPKGVGEAEARRNAITTLEAVCEHAGKRGVFLGLENHGGVVAEPGGLLEIVRAVKSPWLGVNLDTGNFHGSDPYAELEMVAPYAVSVQHKVSISPRRMGKQESDFARIVQMLRRSNYRGFITLEYEEAEDPMAAVPPLIAHMRRVLLKDAGLA